MLLQIYALMNLLGVLGVAINCKTIFFIYQYLDYIHEEQVPGNQYADITVGFRCLKPG